MDDTWKVGSRIPVAIMNEYHRVNMLESQQDMAKRHKNTRLDLSSIYTYQGVHVLMCQGDEQYVITGIREYARDTITGLKQRFPDNSGDALSAFDMFHLEFLPSDLKSWQDCREMHGVADLKVLMMMIAFIITLGEIM